MSHKKYRTETACLNCGTEVTKKFCPECGQENIETRENFFHLVGHFVSDYFHFDSKFFRSLIPLFTKPGFLTKEYWEGRRVHYIHPLRMFFFITIIFMISTSVFYKEFGPKVKEQMISTKISDPNGELSKLSKLEYDKLMEGHQRRMKKLAAGVDDFFFYLKYLTFFLLPVYALIFKVLYRRTRPFFVDHVVYMIHVQSFGYLLFALLLLLPVISTDFFIPIWPIAFVAMFVYFVISSKRLHQQGWGKTTLKSFLAMFSLTFITIVIMLFYVVVDAMVFKSAIK